MKGISIYRLNGILILITVTSVILHFGKSFLIPLFFAIMLGMLLLPVCARLEKLGMNRVASSLSGVLIIVLFVAALIGVVAAQGVSLADDWPQMQTKGQQLIQDVQQWITSNYDIPREEQNSYLDKGVSKMSASGGQFFQSFFGVLMQILTGFVLVLLYFFFLMWQREKYQLFFLKLVKEENRDEVRQELQQITHVAGQYMIGRLISMGFLAIVYITGFSIVGLPNAVLVALIAVIPTIVPYVGAFIGGFFPLAMAVVGGSPDMIIPILVILIVAQVIDNNIIEPMAEGESLNISPIFTILAIVLGELVWGVAGMILFLPLFAIIKIICDHIPSLHPYSFLLENEVDEPKWVLKIKDWFTKEK